MNGDPIPPGHGEPREDAGVLIPFGTGPGWLPAPLPPDQFGTPLCQACGYYHQPEETCRR